MDEPVYDGRKLPIWGGEGGGLYFRSFGPCEAGYVHNGHKHFQDHWSFLLAGSVRVRYRSKAEGGVEKSAVFIAPYKFVVAADVYHEIESLENGTIWSCVFVQPADADTRAVAYHLTRDDDPIEKFDG